MTNLKRIALIWGLVGGLITGPLATVNYADAGLRAVAQSNASQTYSSPTFTGVVTQTNADYVAGGCKVLGQSGVAVASPLDTSENTLATIAVPANALGTNGRLRIRAMFTADGSAGNKTFRIKFGVTNFFSSVRTNPTTNDIWGEIVNLNAANSQRSSSWAETTSAAQTFGASATGSIDTTSAQNLLITMQKATGTEVVSLVWYYVELCRP